MKDNIKQAMQVILIVLGPLLIKHHITFGNNFIDELAGTLSDTWGIIWKFWHWNKTPDVPIQNTGNATASTVRAFTGSGIQSGFALFRMLLLVATISTAVLCFVTGCASLSQTDVTRIANVSKQAATVGTQEIIASHPDWKPQFQLASAQLHQLAISPSIGVADILKIAQQLPVKELKSQTARLSFEGATLLISAIDVPELPADRLAQLQPIAEAIAEGIDAGLQ